MRGKIAFPCVLISSSLTYGENDGDKVGETVLKMFGM